ncbi:MAG: helix-turn-helix domain-containing protein, partial [Gammaproteobacteria bacterium]|nr:helix-turn-helix domain-containing protein [Gammaproteobacteria bacterium]
MGVEEMGEASTLTVSDQLRQAREAAGMTQAAVAEQLFLTETFIRY